MIGVPQYTQSWNGEVPVIGTRDGKDLAFVNLEPLVADGGRALTRFAVNLEQKIKVDGPWSLVTVPGKDPPDAREFYAIVDSVTKELVYLFEENPPGIWGARHVSEYAGQKLMPVMPSLDKEMKVTARGRFEGPVIPDAKAGNLVLSSSSPPDGNLRFAVFLRDIWGNETPLAVPIPVATAVPAP
jgi:hypothetical protein